jgi:hypothetical protein
MYATDPKMAKKWEKETPKGRRLPEKKAEMKKLAYALSLEIEKNAFLGKALMKLLSKLKGAPKRVRAQVSGMPKDEAAAFLTGLASPLPGGSVAAWKGYKGVKSLAKHGPPFSNYRKMNKAVERSRMSKMGSVLAKYAQLTGEGSYASPRTTLTQGPTGQGLPGYKKGGPVKKDGYLTDKKGRPYARVHKGERVISKKRAPNV